jgi:hypothetical protein
VIGPATVIEQTPILGRLHAVEKRIVAASLQEVEVDLAASAVEARGSINARLRLGGRGVARAATTGGWLRIGGWKIATTTRYGRRNRSEPGSLKEPSAINHKRYVIPLTISFRR